MKRLLLLLTFFLMQTYCFAQTTEGLVAFYPFNGNAIDSSENGFNGMINGEITWVENRFDNPEGAFQLNGDTASFISLPDLGLGNSSTDKSFCAWFKLNTNNTNHILSIIGQWINASNRWHMTISQNGIVFYEMVEGGHNLPYLLNVAIDTTNFHFITALCSDSYPTNQKVKIFLDGQFIGAISSYNINTFPNNYNVGRFAQNYWEPVSGIIDDIRIYNRTLSEAEIQELYHEGGWTGRELNTIIITHGFTGEGNPPLNPITETKWKHLIWQFAIADAVSDNRDIYLIRKGNVYPIQATYSQFASINADSSIEYVINNYGVSRAINPQKDNVFIFDWTLESAINEHGFAEAGADVLAATLVKLSIEYPLLLNHLHFIGHSRGCVVNSEAIERLIYWASNDMLPNGINLDPEIHMTTLDAHPAGHWLGLWGTLVPMDDDRVNSFNIGVAGWKGGTFFTKYIDNYFETNFNFPDNPFIGLDAYPGLNLVSPSNNDLSTILDTANAHGLVHTWYYGTIDTVATKDEFGWGEEILRNQWYNSTMGKTQGFYYSRNRLGNLSLTEITSISDNLKNVSIDSKYGNDFLIFNGNFSKSFYINAAGWSYQGGVTPKVHLIGGNISATLTLATPILNHNMLYIPNNVEHIWFRTRTLFPSSDVSVKVYIADEFITSFQLNNSFPNFVWKKFTIPFSVKGQSSSIRFELTSNVSPLTSVLIDDVGFWALTGIRSNVACPVDFHIYDNLGNHTGPTSDTTYVEEIPGSEYYIYEDSTGEKIKTVFLESLVGNSAYNFKIESRDTTSFFSYEIEDYSDTTNGTVTFKFDSIAIEPNTVATCTLETNTEIPLLNVDIDGDGLIDSVYTPIIITAVETDGQSENILPTEFQLYQNYPNPFNPATRIKYAVSHLSKVIIKVFDILGREVSKLVNEEKPIGTYEINFDASELSSGIYFYQIQAGSFIQTKKMILLK